MLVGLDRPFARGPWGWGLTGAPEVALFEVVWAVVGKVVDQPAVAEGTVSHVGDPELSRGVNQAVSFMNRLECRILGLESINFGDWEISVSK